MNAESRERTIPYPEDLPHPCQVQDLLDWVKAHYWTEEELTEAVQKQRESCYEAALSLLVSRGVDELRNSCEPQTPRLFITIPGGRILVHQPGSTANDMMRVATLMVGELARLVLLAHVDEHSPALDPATGMLSLWDDLDLDPTLSQTSVQLPRKREKRGTRATTPPKALVFDELPVRMGNKTLWHTAPGWVVRQRGLAFVLEAQRDGAHDLVSIVHVESNRVLTSFEVTHHEALVQARVRAYMQLVVPLTDWTQGMQAILAEKQGARKQSQWSLYLLNLWWEQERSTLFPLKDEVVSSRLDQ